ncbi:hypothetical protein Gogos_019048 [Gossypium gossypioides]|uniref:RNase H type-1 domain-containing protein n=1 Tax=Gossypium gossypioides TaxID=34282 RepID=A0A7J9BG91_GOSGO|nr:hypothetical protein [Gossypium gossypioides]
METFLAIQYQACNDLDSTLVKRIHQLLSRIGHWVIRHISREDNGEADGISKLVQEKREGLQVSEWFGHHLSKFINVRALYVYFENFDPYVSNDLPGRMRPKGEQTHFVSVQETFRRCTKLILVVMSQHGMFDVAT